MENTTGATHIIFADDNEHERLLFGKIIQYLNFPVKFTAADSGEKLFEILDATNALPDLIVLDYDMPRQSGIECLLKIRTTDKLSHIPVIIYSSTATELQVDTAYFNLADYYIKKVVDIDDLTAILNWLILNKPKRHIRHPRQNFLLSAENLPEPEAN